MQVTIIGSGNMAKGISSRLLSGGHNITLHARDNNEATNLIGDLSSSESKGQITAAAIGSKADKIVILATPYTEIDNIAKSYDGFKDKIVVDITNPVDFTTFQLIPEPGRSGAQEIADSLPNATVIKAFNTNLAGALLAWSIEDRELDVFVAGDDQQAKTSVCEMVNTSGMRAIDVGPLANARHLEGLGLIQMAIQEQIGTNWMSSLKFLG